MVDPNAPQEQQPGGDELAAAATSDTAPEAGSEASSEGGTDNAGAEAGDAE